MLRASSETAVATSMTSVAENPSRDTRVRPDSRADMMSSSVAIATVVSPHLIRGSLESLAPTSISTSTLWPLRWMGSGPLLHLGLMARGSRSDWCRADDDLIPALRLAQH